MAEIKEYIVRETYLLLSGCLRKVVGEIVRCKDCKYWNPKSNYCEGIGNWFGYVNSWSENGFCYKGEREE